MINWLLRRTAAAVISFVGITFVLFWLVRYATHSLPLGDSDFQQYGFIGSLLDEYQAWLTDFLTGGGLSQSLITGRSASTMVLERLPPTLLLMGTALVIEVAVGVPLGILAAVRARRKTDHGINVLAALSNSAPPFLTALIAVYIFADILQVLPAGSMWTASNPHPDLIDYGRHLILPALVLASLGVGRIIRHVRAAMLETLSANYLVTARAKGLSHNQASIRHALPNALLPVITVIGLSIGTLLGGAFLVEIVFNWPGMGRVAYDALSGSVDDYPVLLAFAAVCAIGVLLSGLLADVAYLVVDPRLRAGQLAPVRRPDEATIPRPVVQFAALALIALIVASSAPPALLQRFTYTANRVTPGATPVPVGGCIGHGDGSPCGPPIRPTPRPQPRPSGALADGPSPSPTPRLPDPAARVAAVMAGLRRGVGTPGAPGCSVGISQGGKVVYAKGFGTADLATGAPITPTTVYDVSSLATEFTAASILLLAGDGKLNLQDDIHAYVPELPQYDVVVTVADLVDQTSGLPSIDDALFEAGFNTEARLKFVSTADLAAAARSLQTLVSPPGKTYAFSNTNYVLLRIVVERLSGESFPDFTRQRIFEPLGMTDTFFDTKPKDVFAGKATPYLFSGPETAPWVPMDVAISQDLGAAGLQTTALDLLKWAGNVDSGVVGGAAMQQAEALLLVGSDDGYSQYSGRYGAGYHVWLIDGLRIAFQDAGYDESGFRAALAIDSADHVAVGLACNAATFAPHLLSFAILEAWLGVPSSITADDMVR